ncbi:MAG TPA: DUF2252 domain-containing protein [Acidobacteriaceae bacterium]|jgi:uncharacterized protein (DUF2252 family)|nr:DUF2252 domain-containing protein [Acidobacteriaceae bacterium]
MPHFPTAQERRALGQTRRKQVRRQDHAYWDAKLRTHNPLRLIDESMRGRVPGLVGMKYERMLASPFGFFRGAAPVMAADLALLPHTGIVNQICGDAHVRNLGAYAAPDGRLLFDINDFDETIQGPFEWDLKRLATSLVLAARETAGESNGSKAGRAAVVQFVASYRKLVQTLSRMPVVEVARYQVHRLQRISPVSQALLKAERATPLHTLDALTTKTKKGRCFREEPPVLRRLSPAQARPVLAALKSYRESLLPERQHFFSQYWPVDVAFKVVGTGSVGLRDYLVYLEGNGERDPLFLQVKEEPGSAYAPYLPGAMGTTGGGSGNQGKRVADGQRAMQFASDPFLGWTTITSRDYLVRQLNDHKGSIEIPDLQGQGLIDYAEMCGELLARGHARSGDACRLAGYMGTGKKFEEALAAFAEAYADQTEKDWKDLKRSRV